jgi:hypothetical protein
VKGEERVSEVCICLFLLFFFPFFFKTIKHGRGGRLTNCDPTKSAERLIFHTKRMFLQKDCCLLDCVPNFSVLFIPTNGESRGKKKVALNVVLCGRYVRKKRFINFLI